MSNGELTPALALRMRLDFLEAALFGASSSAASAADSQAPASALASGNSLARRVDVVTDALERALSGDDSQESTDALRYFVKSFDANRALLETHPLLLPASSNSNASNKSGSKEAQEHPQLAYAAKALLVAEADTALRSLERDGRELMALDERDVAGAGQLDKCAELRPQLESVQQQVIPVDKAYAELYERVHSLTSHYSAYINDMSELFVDWHELVSSAEREVTRLEREQKRQVDIS